MWLKPQEHVNEREVHKGLLLVLWDGLTAEVMIAFTGGAFVVSMALLLGANNMQIGLLASIPTFTNLSQLLAVWLVKKLQNRRIIVVLCCFLARFPLIIIGVLIFLGGGTSISTLLFFLFVYYLFGAISSPSWNSWMKDLIPEDRLGQYFSKRTRYNQMLNVVLSISLALVVDFVKGQYPQWELQTYAVFFIVAGSVGIVGGYILSKVKEPQTQLSNANIFTLFSKPLKDINFRKLLIFNSAWVFAINLAIPFFTVFMLKTLGLPISYIIGLFILSQLGSIFTLRIWGMFSDRYSNKTIIAIAAPIYITCLIAWCFVGIYSSMIANIILLAAIHIGNGVSTAGINLSLTNIGLKLAPKEEAVVYLSIKNIVTSVFSSISPLIGGFLADYLVNVHVTITADLKAVEWAKQLRLVALHEWNFLFLIAAFLAFIALQLLINVREVGEIEKDYVRKIMRKSLKNNLKEYFIIGNIINMNAQFRTLFKSDKKRP